MNNGVENVTNNNTVNYQGGVNTSPSLSAGPELQSTVTPAVPAQPQVSSQPELQPSITPASNSAVAGQAVNMNVMPSMNPNVGVVPGQNTTVSPVNMNAGYPQTAYPQQASPNMNYPQTQGTPAASQPAPEKSVEYKPPGTFKVICMIILFLGIVAFVYFLPDISEMMEKKNEESASYQEDISEEEEQTVSGDLVCSLTTSDERFDTEYRLEFHYTDSELEKTKLVVTTKGDASLDSAALDVLNLNCQNLKNEVLQLEGISVSCNYTAGKLVETQTYDLARINQEEATPFFAEAGGTYLEYPYHHNIRKIQEDMTASEYICQMN
ncbi:MAG: hypothetical protein IJI60_01340 [Bacilli bacterium]|nr:hypothetical protein [Bacilli bacterium]